jgi:hypothetical protein
MQIGETILLSAILAPPGLTLLDEVEETVIATLSPPKLQAEVAEEIEAETELVGEGEEAEEAGEEEAAAEDASEEE